MKFAVFLETAGLLVFTILCQTALPISFLIPFLLYCKIGLIWMTITILKNRNASTHTFDEKFYEDKDR